ncbi:adenosylcobinamide-GDP ribazoletransferase [Flavihumibacter stibioxidans]|uniref:Adenosylcobinamide-GDP ribazoletransferase n=1 Tax=Flavihumibacter stibioxidans TaxID=1834163 RepID=A0ABR7M8Q1_9BACT|nr:adenosylcobinamide-GDP ribazoletransferase [Flavihumibacter stibioxidans]MBC6491001.1 hypothetical protein [Flavihumibacter stibioxidans]
MRNQYHYFLAALQFLTRIKVPDSFSYKPEYLERSSTYFPLVGSLVAAIGVMVYLVVNKYLGQDLAIFSFMLTTIWVTGAFHEDGLADTCDAFGGGWTKEKILTIMKDSRLGTYGMIGLLGVLALKFLLLKELMGVGAGVKVSDIFPPALSEFKHAAGKMSDTYPTYPYLLLLIAAHSASRFMAITIIQQYEYVTDIDQSKSKPLSRSPLTWRELLFSFALAVWPLVFLSPWFWLVLVPMFVARTMLAQYFKRWIGGYTGDCLGATQQVTEIIFYLSALIIWRFIL